MGSAHFIKDYRHLLKHFNRKEYSEHFEIVRADLEKYLEGLSSEGEGDIGSLIEEDVNAILDDIREHVESAKFKVKKDRLLYDDRLVLSLFIAPAAAKIGSDEAMRFAELLSESWNIRYPESPFTIGDYDKIASGFKGVLSLFTGR